VHVPRPFYEFYTFTQSPLAAEVLARIAKLYEIEADIRGQPPDVRRGVRQLRSRPPVATHLPLRLWFRAIYHLTQTKQGSRASNWVAASG
jgi:transposase